MKDNLAIIGAGVIGGAITKCLLKSDYEGKITATRRTVEKLKELQNMGATVTRDNRKATKDSDIIFLCVKPHSVKKVLDEIEEEIDGKLVISTAAILPLKFYKGMVPKAYFIRTMPNIAILVQESFTAYCCDEGVSREHREKCEELLNLMGTCKEVEEKHMDAVTALSGSGPGYLSVIMEAMVYAGLKVGLPRDLSLYSSAQTILGTGKLALQSEVDITNIKDMVTTPGGTTIEAIYHLEASQIRHTLMKAVEEATKKSENIRKNWGSSLKK
ncbi:MAG: pyrroline-5-carboxylate reductase [Thermoproteota archaeon]